MSLMIATPMYGRRCHSRYFISCLNLRKGLMEAGVEHDFLVTENESLITRARNTTVARFRQTDYQKLLFIDGDIEFSENDVAKLWNLEVPVTCGAYRMKWEGSPLSIWRDGKMVDLQGIDHPVDVDYAGTGFMMIDRSVFDDLESEHPEWMYEEGKVGYAVAFFQDVIHEMQDGTRYHESEDYFFCRSWRELGGEVICHPDVNLTHWGECGYARVAVRDPARKVPEPA